MARGGEDARGAGGANLGEWVGEGGDTQCEKRDASMFDRSMRSDSDPENWEAEFVDHSIFEEIYCARPK